MWSMWNAPSDRDYYEPYGPDDEDEQPQHCQHCGAREDQACEEWCDTNTPASEAPPSGQTGLEASPDTRSRVSTCPSTGGISLLLEDCVFEPNTGHAVAEICRSEDRPMLRLGD
jgi:hypothetical protein